MPDQALIAPIGETGSGKTTFVNRATNSEAFPVGNGLHSCTSEIQVSPQFLVDNKPVVLIDTPGFNDTVMEDAEVLESVSAFLAMVYGDKFKLAGVIYFHRISDERWRRSDTRNFGWLRRICGETTLGNVVLATNMWGNVIPEIGAIREQQLATEFVKSALDKGAQLHRHHDTTESAHQTIRVILNNHQTRTPLQVQRGIVDEKREFNRTTVGEEINREVDECTKKLKGEIGDLENALKTVEDREKETRSQLEAEIVELRATIEKLAGRSRNMNANFKRVMTGLRKRFAFLRTPVGFSVSCIILGALYFVKYYFEA